MPRYSRKGAAGLMYLWDVLINLLHLKKLPVLRSVRKFSANPNPIKAWYNGPNQAVLEEVL